MLVAKPFYKIVTWFNIIPEYGNVLVSVRARVLVGETQDVHHLVDDVAERHAVVAEDAHLGTILCNMI